MNKIWHKPLHKRKVWKRMSLFGKTLYYMQPFVIQLINIWLQPLPFPTLFKIILSWFLIVLIMLPVVVPIVITLTYYAIVQYLLESALGIVYPAYLDIIHYTVTLFNFEIRNEKYVEILNLYFDKGRYITSAFAACIDYMRLFLDLITN